jgi:hypothetical protein
MLGDESSGARLLESAEVYRSDRLQVSGHLTIAYGRARHRANAVWEIHPVMKLDVQ